MEDLNYQNGNLKMKFEGIERELFMKINELEQKYNEKERESISNLAIIRNNEQELIDLRNENRFLKGEIDDVKSEKIKRSNFVTL